MQMTIYDAATVGSRSNCVYPNPVTVTDADTMRQAAAFDHVCAAYKQNYRSVDNFLKADCLPMDCDNDHSDDPDDWLTPFDVAMDFPGVGMIFVYSKSHMKQKGKRGPRPRFHVYFICTETTNSEIYSSWKDRLIADYPYFDDGAKDSARFLFGVKNAVVEVYDGEITIDEFLADRFAEWDAVQGQILEGSRNNTMSHYAGRVIKRLGNTEEAHKQFLKEAEKCSPPLDDAELAGIWASAVKFGAKVAAQDGYIPPEQYNQDFLLMPEDFSDVGQAIVLSREYMDRLRFSPATDYIVFNGSFWEESQPNAQGKATWKMPEDFLMKVSRLADKTDEILPKVLEAGAEVVEDKVRSNLQAVIGSGTKYESRSTGELLRSLGTSPALQDKNGDFNVKVGFSEPRSDGDSNAKIATILEYGKSGQPAKPFLKPAQSSSRNACISAMKAKLDEEVEKI